MEDFSAIGIRNWIIEPKCLGSNSWEEAGAEIPGGCCVNDDDDGVIPKGLLKALESW